MWVTLRCLLHASSRLLINVVALTLFPGCNESFSSRCIGVLLELCRKPSGCFLNVHTSRIVFKKMLLPLVPASQMWRHLFFLCYKCGSVLVFPLCTRCPRLIYFTFKMKFLMLHNWSLLLLQQLIPDEDLGLCVHSEPWLPFPLLSAHTEKHACI